MRQHMKRNNNYIWKQTQVTKGDTVTNKKLTLLAQDLCCQACIKQESIKYRENAQFSGRTICISQWSILLTREQAAKINVLKNGM